MIKTVILIPLYNSGKTLPTLFEALYTLSPQPNLYVFAENNSSDDTLEQVRQFKLPHKIIRVWFRKDAVMINQNRYVTIAQIRQLLLTFARDFDPDYAIFLDSDVIPQTTKLIDSLTSWKKDILGGAYLRPFPNGIYLASRWKHPTNKGATVLRQKISLPLEEPLVTSAGCMCLSRKIIQNKRINFYPTITGTSEDFGYCLKAREHGYKVFLDGVTKLKHMIPEMLIKPWSRSSRTNQYEPFFYEMKAPKKDAQVANKKLKIGLLATRFFGIHPSCYAGLEQIIWDLAYALDKLGHEVTLFAPKGSKPPPHGKLVETGEAYQSLKANWLQGELETYDSFRDKLENLDILHGHTHHAIEYFGKIHNPNLPVTHTHHNINLSWLKFYKPLFKLNLISVSDWTRHVFGRQEFISRRCYNGINLDKYPFQAEKTDRLMFLGRIIKGKAPHLAIKVAKEAGVGLDIIGSTTAVNDLDYVNEVKNLCDGKQIRFIGEVSQETKLHYLQNARAILMPSQWGEPFGLVSVEAMACGTVPIALDDGALKEIIVDGQSGFICNTVDQMVNRIKALEFIDPQICRERAEQFSREKMAQEYVKLYTQIINGQEW